MLPCRRLVYDRILRYSEADAYHVADLSGSTSEEEDDWAASRASILVAGGTNVVADLTLCDLDVDWSSGDEGGEEGNEEG